jgi:hypothetical protein
MNKLPHPIADGTGCRFLNELQVINGTSAGLG